MYPHVQLIQLTLRVEREAEAQRRAYLENKADSIEERPIRLPKRAPHLERACAPLYCQPQCQCA